jgi:hypothetical protein
VIIFRSFIEKLDDVLILYGDQDMVKCEVRTEVTWYRVRKMGLSCRREK